MLTRLTYSATIPHMENKSAHRAGNDLIMYVLGTLFILAIPAIIVIGLVTR